MTQAERDTEIAILAAKILWLNQGQAVLILPRGEELPRISLILRVDAETNEEHLI